MPDAMHPDAIQAHAPASKSISHRLLIASALACGSSTLEGVLASDDTLRTRQILRLAGAGFEPLPSRQGCESFRVRGTSGRLAGGTDEPLSCNAHESGTTCRLLTAVLATGSGRFRIHGAERLHRRPIGELARVLALLGVPLEFEAATGCPPVRIDACGLHAGRLPLDREDDGGWRRLGVSMEESSQYFSGLLLAAPLADAPLVLALAGAKAVSWPYIGLTLKCLADFGIRFEVEERDAPDGTAPWRRADWRQIAEALPGRIRVKIQPSSYRAGHFRVEGDWSGASYFAAAGALGKRPVRIEGVDAGSLQGDRAILDILERMGGRWEAADRAVAVPPARLHGARLDMGRCPDLVPTVCAMAAFADGETVIENVAHLRIKESDRIKAPCEALRAIGCQAEEREDGMRIQGLGSSARIRLQGLALKASNDHRMAMSQALFSLRACDMGTSEVRSIIDNPACVNKSFPEFWHAWEAFADD